MNRDYLLLFFSGLMLAFTFLSILAVAPNVSIDESGKAVLDTSHFEMSLAGLIFSMCGSLWIYIGGPIPDRSWINRIRPNGDDL